MWERRIGHLSFVAISYMSVPRSERKGKPLSGSDVVRRPSSYVYIYSFCKFKFCIVLNSDHPIKI